jgi:two-component system LytT family response regulator
MQTLDALIVDDEPGARRDLQQVLAAVENVRVVAQASDAAAARQMARRHRPQLIFMDIHLPGADGFSAVEALDDKLACVIFTTAYAQYAVRAFEFGAVDYLLKPVDEKRCRRAVERAREQLARQENAALAEPQPLLEIEERGAHVRVPLADIRLVTAEGNYLEVDHGGQLGLIRQTLENFLAGPSGAPFTRISRSQAVRLSAVRSYRGSATSGLRLYLGDGEELSVSRRRAPEVSAALRASGHAPAREA